MNKKNLNMQTPIGLYKQQRKPDSPKKLKKKLKKDIKIYGVPTSISGFDIDGVISIGIHPGPQDVIITGRSFNMYKETFKLLHSKGIYNPVYFNPIHRSLNTREQSALWKAQVINNLGGLIKTFFEDDPLQWEIIQKHCPNVQLIYVMSNLTEK